MTDKTKKGEGPKDAELPKGQQGAEVFRKRLPRKVWVIFGIVALIVFFWGSMRYIDGLGWHFFNSGREAIITLSKLAEALRDGDLAPVKDLYAPAYQGKSLGMNSLRKVDERDGVRVYAFGGGSQQATREGALTEWQTYLDGFETVHEAGLYIHRLESWDDDIVATVRFEVIGKPKGEAESGIDRALFRMHFARKDGVLQIRSAEPVEGDRVINSRPLFVDVGPQAGINFENQYYPGFLNQPLKFGMLRYGPAGITAADYNDDGLCDLFIPDGVASRLFRNSGDGSFEDVTEATGLAGLSGVSVGLFADYDNDGDKDFFVSRTYEPNQLFENQGNNTFVDVTERAGIGPDNSTTVASWADYNNDGFLDLYVGRYLEARERIPTTFYARNGEPNRLYRNNGDGTFTDVTVEAGVGELGLCLGTAFGDYNNDGFPDLYVSNDFGRKTLYKNNGDGTFDDVTVETGTLAYGAGMSSTIGDYDNDGNLDLYVAHIRSEEGWFAEWPTVLRYMANSWRQNVWLTDMPLYFEIFRQSGFQFVQVFQDMASGNTLMRNRGDGTFEDVSWKANANPPGWFWGTNMADFDNDGWPDLYAANGWVYNDRNTEIELEFLNKVVSEQKLYKTGYLFDPNFFGKRSWHGWERNRFLRNNGDGTFKEIGRGNNTDLILNSRGTAVADFWNRGVMDLAVAASTDRHALLRNEINADRNWIEVKLIGSYGELPNGTNRDAVGARVSLRSGEKKMVREVILGDGYGSQSMLRLHFGVDQLSRIDELVVTWPRSGIVQRFENVTPNHFYEIVEGQDRLVSKDYQAGRGDE